MDKEIEDVISYLENTGRYSRLIKTVRKQPIPSFIFELLFAYSFESKGLALDYEVNISPDTDLTIDFVYEKDNSHRLCFELVSPEISEQLKPAFTPQPAEPKGVSVYEVCLESSHPNEHFRPEAQTIRLQEKLLEKLEKFPQPRDFTFSIIVVDCSSFHCGHLDSEDCRMVMYGRTQNTDLQEFWNGKQILGLLDERYVRRWAKEFRERIVSVIFVPNLKINLLDKAYISLNFCMDNQYLNNFVSQTQNNPALRNLRHVPLPNFQKQS